MSAQATKSSVACQNLPTVYSSFRRFLARLLLVHGSLSHYRLARLIKYSFYKNILFCFVLFFFQFYCGFSGASRCLRACSAILFGCRHAEQALVKN